MSDTRREAAQSVFNDFAVRMNAWETASHEACKPENGGFEKNLPAIRNVPVESYDRFLTRRERKTGRLAAWPDVGYPPGSDGHPTS